MKRKLRLEDRQAVGIILLAMIVIGVTSRPRSLADDWNGSLGLWTVMATGLLVPRKWLRWTFLAMAACLAASGEWWREVALRTREPLEARPYEQTWLALWFVALVFAACGAISFARANRRSAKTSIDSEL